VVETDAVVLVTARTPMDSLYREISGRLESEGTESVPTLHKIGDCDAPAIIAAAVYAGHRYARELETDVAATADVRHDKLFDPD
jgi:dimethylamine/trimethylamine dehydrogenase